MADNELSFTFAAGEDATFDVEVEDEAGADLSANVFEYRIFDSCKAAVFSLADAGMTRVTGALRIVIPRATTAIMQPGAVYSHNLWMIDGTFRRQIAAGPVVVLEGQPR